MKALHGEKVKNPSRRDAMAWGLWTILGVIAASTAVPVIGLIASRQTARKKLVFRPVMPVDDMPEVGVRKAEITLRGGELPDTRVFVRRDADGRLTAFSAICTHLGCLVNFNNVKREFICPCHGGRYDLDGRVIAGPPPAPLARLPVHVEGGSVMVGFYL